MLWFKIIPTLHVFLLSYTLDNVFAKCYFMTSRRWDEDWYTIKRHTSVTCFSTSIEDYTYDLFELGIVRPESTQFLDLSIFNSNFSFIDYLINPASVHEITGLSNILINLSITFCEVKTIATNAFQDLNDLTNIDLGYNDIDDINFVSHLPKSVKNLNLRHNKIKDVNFGLFVSSLNFLDLSFNRITHLAIFDLELSKSFPIKNYLYLNNNNITEIKLHPGIVSNELKVNLAFNNLTLFECNDTYRQVNVKLFNLSHSFTYLGILNVSKLNFKASTLIFANNDLLTLEEDYDFSYCSHLDFSNCSLANIYNTIFQESTFNCLNFSHNNFKQLSGFLFARSKIQTLDLSHNQIENINHIFQYAHIVNLNLTSNRISELNSNSFTNLASLYALDLSFNRLKLSNSSFINCKDAVILNLASSKILHIEPLAFTGLSQLQTLNLEDNLVNVLSTIVFKPLVAIREINLLNNKLTIIQSYLFSSLPIKTLILSGNDIEGIEANAFHNLTSIQRIKINENNRPLSIENDAFSHFPETQIIDLKKSKITNIGLKIFSEVALLNVLDLRDNNITSVDFSSHTEYIRLKELHVTFNGILKTKSFLRSIYLEKLTFWNSKIKNIETKAFQGLFNLKILELKDSIINSITRGALDGLFTLKSLDSVNIFKNQHTLNNFMFKDLHTLKNLNLSSIELQKIKSFSFNGLKSLTNLYLSHNNITSFKNFTFYGLENLIVLDLCHNDLTVIKRNDFEGLIGLNVLNIGNNNINDMHLGALQNFPQLETLYMGQNNLTEFKVGIFSNLTNLKNLDLRQNSISSILFDLFLPLKSLVYLNLEINNLKTIGNLPLVSTLKFLKRVGIAKNKWKCDYLSSLIVTFRNYSIDYSSIYLNYYDDNIEGIECIDICKYLLCLQDSHGIN